LLGAVVVACSAGLWLAPVESHDLPQLSDPRRSSSGHQQGSRYGGEEQRHVAGYVVKHKDGRRNRYQIQAHLPLPEPASQEPAIGDVLAILIGDEAKQEPAPGAAAPEP